MADSFPCIRPLSVLAERIRIRRQRLAMLVERAAPPGVLTLEADVLLSLMAEQAERLQRLKTWLSPSAS